MILESKYFTYIAFTHRSDALDRGRGFEVMVGCDNLLWRIVNTEILYDSAKRLIKGSVFMGLYEELSARKSVGEILRFGDLTSSELKQIYINEGKTDKIIADLYGVKQSKVTYKRRKHGITIRNSILDDYLLVNSPEAKEMNALAKKQILDTKNINMISKAITHFAFRNGPVENMHAHPNNQLSESDMKTLNKFMVNRLAYVFTLIIEGRWIEFDLLIRNLDWMYGIGWDEAEPDDGGTRKLIEMLMKNNKKRI